MGSESSSVHDTTRFYISDFEEKKTEKTNLEEMSKLLDYFYIGENLIYYLIVYMNINMLLTMHN